MKTNIYFVKHAESESNINPAFNGSVDGLTEKGIKQSKRVANYLFLMLKYWEKLTNLENRHERCY